MEIVITNTYQVLPLVWAIICNVIAAVLIGTVVGFDRQVHRKATCIKSNALICMGSCLFVMIGYIQQFINIATPVDTTRIISQVVSGIGFIGAGVIFKDRTWGVSGITTASTIWCVAALGVICAAGFPALAALAVTVIILLLNLIPRRGPPRQDDQG